MDLWQYLSAPYDWFNAITDFVFLFVRDLFARFGTPMVFIAALIESTVGLGMLFPGVVIMFLGGAAAAQGTGNVSVVFLVALAGTVLGDVISYALGRWGARYIEGTRLGPTLKVAAALMQGRALWLVPFYHLHSVTRTLGPFGSGALRMSLRLWVPLDFIGAAVANVAWVGAGYILGTAVLTDDGRLEEAPALRIGLAAGAVAWMLVAQRMYERRMRELRAAEVDAPPSA